MVLSPTAIISSSVIPIGFTPKKQKLIPKSLFAKKIDNYLVRVNN